MTNLSTLKALRERVENASGPDREIDADIWQALEFPYSGSDAQWRRRGLDGINPTIGINATLRLHRSPFSPQS